MTAPVPVLVSAETHVGSGEHATRDRLIDLPRQRTPHAPRHAHASCMPLNRGKNHSHSVTCPRLAAPGLCFTSGLGGIWSMLGWSATMTIPTLFALGSSTCIGWAACCTALDQGIEVGRVECARNERYDGVMHCSGWL